MASATIHARDDRPVGHQVGVGVAFVVATFAAAALGSVATTGTTDGPWFRSLEVPPWYPPAWAFSTVWTVLYVMIALAGWLAWRSGAPTRALVAWATQIVLNLGWSLVFFGARRPGWAMAEIVLLFAAVAWTTWELRAVDRIAFLLFAPYLGWVAFAGSLNAAIVVLN